MIGMVDRGRPVHQRMFSWAEFLALEPVKPRGRRHEPQPASASTFEWAPTLEQALLDQPAYHGDFVHTGRVVALRTHGDAVPPCAFGPENHADSLAAGGAANAVLTCVIAKHLPS